MAKFSKYRVSDKVLQGSMYLVCEIPKFPYNTESDRCKEASMPKTQLDSSTLFDAIPACVGLTDGQTDEQVDGQTHDDSMYRSCIKNKY